MICQSRFHPGMMCTKVDVKNLPLPRQT